MDRSHFLARVIGLYLLIISVAMLTQHQQFLMAINLLIHNQSLIFVFGFFVLILGLLMVVGHWVWEANWRVCVTLIGCITLLKGLNILFFPRYMDQVSMMFVVNHSIQYVSIVADLFLGLMFCYFGFKADNQK